MIALDKKMKVYDPEIFPKHTIADLNSGTPFYCFVQSGEAFAVKGNTHTHTYTQQNSATCLLRVRNENNTKFYCKKIIKSASLEYSQYVHDTNLRHSVQDLSAIRPTFERDDYTQALTQASHSFCKKQTGSANIEIVFTTNYLPAPTNTLTETIMPL